MAYNTKVYRIAALLRSNRNTIRNCIGNEYLGCKIDYYDVGDLQDLRRIFLDVKDSYDGILTSGVLSDRFIACNNTDNAVAHRYISATENNYFRQLLLLYMEYPGLDLSRVRLDLMTNEHDLPMMIQKNILRKKMNEEHAAVYRLNEAGVLNFEREMADRQIRAMKSGEYDIFMTRSPLVLEQAEQLNLKTKVVYVDYAEDEIYSAVKNLRNQIEKQDLQQSQVACIRFCLPENSDEKSQAELYQCMEELVHGQRKLSMMLQTLPGGMEAITDAGTVNAITNERTYCELWSYLNEEKGIPVSLGFGIGDTVKDARDHAAQAVRYLEAEPDRGRIIYLLDSAGDVYTMSSIETGESRGRSMGTAQPAVMTATVNRIARYAHLSSHSVFRLMTALQKAHRNEATAEWISGELDISPRMSNKMLANLEKAGFARITGKALTTGKGRPCNIYSFDFEVM